MYDRFKSTETTFEVTHDKFNKIRMYFQHVSRTLLSHTYTQHCTDQSLTSGWLSLFVTSFFVHHNFFLVMFGWCMDWISSKSEIISQSHIIDSRSFTPSKWWYQFYPVVFFIEHVFVRIFFKKLIRQFIQFIIFASCFLSFLDQKHWM